MRWAGVIPSTTSDQRPQFSGSAPYIDEFTFTNPRWRMRVEARSNSGAALPAGYLDSRRGYTESADFALMIGSEYAVYGVTTFLVGVWYYVLDGDRNPWPVWKPAPLFDIVDPQLPAG
jgi:hypothetical protein